MPRDVVDSFFEDEKNFAPHLGINFHVLIRLWCGEVEFDVARGQTVISKAAHAVPEIDYVVTFGIDGPNNVQLNHPSQPISISGIAERGERKHDERNKPPALPDWQQD